MTETIKRLGSIIGNFVKEKSKMMGLFYVDARKEPYDEEDQYSEMLYELPPGKYHHLYIAHSDEDSFHALVICRELERRFQLRCMLPCRDISPGVVIISEIEYQMTISDNVLLLLSPDFLRSELCDLAVSIAVLTSYDSNFNVKIIPVILRDIDAGCDLPPLLKHYVCIDVRKENDCCAKIIEAICHTGKTHYDIDRRLVTIVIFLLSLYLFLFSFCFLTCKKKKHTRTHTRTHFSSYKITQKHNKIYNLEYIISDNNRLLLGGTSYRSGLPKSAFRYENGRRCVSLGTGIKEDTYTVEIDNQIFYELPPGKKYHIFIAHSTVDHQLAVDICKELERRFLLKCMLFDRDFLPAKPIDVNVQHELEKSVKVLLLLSPDFLKSQWCDMEARLAVQMCYDPNFKLKIIPVLVRGLNVDSNLPPFLKPFRYIDAQKESDCPAKINEAFYQIGNTANLINIFSNFFKP